MPISNYRTNLWKRCPCCHSKTLKTSGTVVLSDSRETLYLAQWSRSNPEHPISFIVLQPSQGTFVSVVYSFTNASFTVIDGRDSIWADEEELRILDRAEVIGQPVAQEVFDYLDEIWLSDKKLRKFTKHYGH